MKWFLQDHTGRQLSSREHAFLTELAVMLNEVRPPQVVREETGLTAEGQECLIVLMPHRALGGVSIVVWLREDKAAVTWAQVGGLGCCHDSLDAGLWVSELPLEGREPSFGPVVASVRAQLHRPITLRLYGYPAASATMHMSNSKGQLQTVGEIGRPLPWMRRFWRGAPDQEVEVRLVDVAAPPLVEESGVDTWFTEGHSRGRRTRG